MIEENLKGIFMLYPKEVKLKVEDQGCYILDKTMKKVTFMYKSFDKRH